MLRFGFAASWERNAEQYTGSGTGSLKELGARFSIDTLGANVFAALGPIESAARIMTGISSFRASLGKSVVHARNSFETTRFTAEYGVTSRLGMTLSVPLVTAVSRLDARMNPLGNEATVGFNPAYFAPLVVTSNEQLVSQFDAAASFVNQRLATCAAQPAATGCAAINANSASARALIDQSVAFTTAMTHLYGGRPNVTGAPFVPVAGGAAQAAIDARVAAFKAQFATFGAQISASSPVGGAPLTASGLQTVLTDSVYRIIAQPLGSVVRRGVGDIDLSAQYTWHDSYAARATATGAYRARLWWRSAIQGTYRLGTGSAATADALIPVSTGDHQNDIEVRSLTDVGVGTAASMTAVLRYTMQAQSTTSVRIPNAKADPFPEAFRTATVTRDPGDEMSLDLYPRWNFSEAVSVAGHYGYRSRVADSYQGSVTGATPAGTTITSNAAVLAEGTEAHEHRVGAILAYSAMAAWKRGRSKWPVEVSIAHFQTTAGSGGTVPKLAYDEINVRVYWRPFGR